MIGGASVVNGHMKPYIKSHGSFNVGMVMRPHPRNHHSSGIHCNPTKLWRKTAALVMNIDDMSKRLKAD